MTRSRGFSLIELAVVVAVLALLAGGTMATLSNQIQVARYRGAERELHRIQTALVAFAATHRNRLPCPDADGDGVEDLTADACRQSAGALPWLTLGTGRLDPWGRGFAYWPDAAFATPAGIANPPDTVDGLTVVETHRARALTLADPHAPAAIVLSCGRNGLADDVNADDVEAGCRARAEGDGVFAHGPPGAAADDVLWWLSKNLLLGALVRAGTWP